MLGRVWIRFMKQTTGRLDADFWNLRVTIRPSKCRLTWTIRLSVGALGTTHPEDLMVIIILTGHVALELPFWCYIPFGGDEGEPIPSSVAVDLPFLRYVYEVKLKLFRFIRASGPFHDS